jgi:multiple sugar transport system permease protein
VNSASSPSSRRRVAVVLNGMAGYAFAKLRFRGRDRLLRLMLLALVVPGQIGMLPLFLLVRSLGLVNSLAGVVIPGLASIFGIFLVRQYCALDPGQHPRRRTGRRRGELGIFRRVRVAADSPDPRDARGIHVPRRVERFSLAARRPRDETRYTLPVGLASLAGEHVQDTEL